LFEFVRLGPEGFQVNDARKLEHGEEYRTISFLMKLSSGRCLRVEKTKEYLRRSSRREDNGKVPPIPSLYFLRALEAFIVVPFRVITERRDIVSLRCQCGI
jgi:hypothetical protein